MLIIYFVSMPLARWANKFAYLKADFRIIPDAWFVPGVNTLAFFVLPFLTVMLMWLPEIKSVDYYKNKWNKEK